MNEEMKNNYKQKQTTTEKQERQQQHENKYTAADSDAIFLSPSFLLPHSLEL